MVRLGLVKGWMSRIEEEKLIDRVLHIFGYVRISVIAKNMEAKV